MSTFDPHQSRPNEHLPLVGYDAIEFWVGNAKQTAHYYATAFGFRLSGYAGPETGVRDRTSYVLEQGGIRFVVSSGLTPDHEIVRHQARHGDGVRDVSFRVHDAAETFALATQRGAAPFRQPTVMEDEQGKVQLASIAVYGDTIHTFVQRDDYSGIHLPGYERRDDPTPAGAPVGLEAIDHVVANVQVGDLEAWSAFYERVFGLSQLRHFDDETISTEYTALMSNVLWDRVGRIKLPINEPATGQKRSQIEEYLEAYGGPGVQHLALATSDIVATVRELASRGVSFLEVPQEYYAEARARTGDLDESWADLAELGILVDHDEEGYLLQIFTEPVQDRPTVFYEIIQRRGASGFGVGNFRALFEAIERSQARRGNL